MHQGVVGQGLGCTFLALAHGVEPVGQLACHLGLAAKFLRQGSGGCLTASVEHADEVVDHFPDREALVGFRVPVIGQLGGLEQPNLASARGQEASLDQARDAGVLRT